MEFPQDDQAADGGGSHEGDAGGRGGCLLHRPAQGEVAPVARATAIAPSAGCGCAPGRWRAPVVMRAGYHKLSRLSEGRCRGPQREPMLLRTQNRSGEQSWTGAKPRPA
jgi:hypothetical protein